MEHITKGRCVDCGFNSVCEEAKQNRIKCYNSYGTDWITKEMEKQNLNPISARDKKVFLNQYREKEAEYAKVTLAYMGMIVVLILFVGISIAYWRHFSILIDRIDPVAVLSAAHNINLVATILVILGSILGIWLVSNVVSSVLILLRHNIRKAKGMFKDIQPNTIYEVTCACGNAIEFNDETLEKGFVVCDKCGERLELHCEDD